MRRGLWTLALACWILGACSNKSSNTKIMVAVWSDLVVPTEIDSIHIAVSGTSTSPSVVFPLTTGNESGKTKLPVVLELVSPDNRGVAFEVVASGFLGPDLQVAQAARLSFDPEYSHVLTLFLDRGCRGQSFAGDLAHPTDVHVKDLPPYDAKTPFLAPDAGMCGGADGGGPETGGIDSVADVRQTGDAVADILALAPDAGMDMMGDSPRTLDASADAPIELVVDAPIVLAADTPSERAADAPTGLLAPADATRDPPGPDSPCVPSTPGCPRTGDVTADTAVFDAGMDALAEDAGMDALAETNPGPDVSADAPVDLPAPVDGARDLAAPDGPSACVLPMTTCAGMCIDPQINVDHCGGCGKPCSSHNGTPSCTAGACSMSSCLSGILNCSADENTSRDGCETNSNTDPSNCGHCGNTCSSRVCRNQTCLATARYGNTGPGTGISAFSTGFLAGIQVYVPNDSVVTGFGAVLYTSTANCNMYLGLYKDVAGNPGDLVATVASPTLVTPGGKEMNVDPPIAVTAGTYWILGVWDGLVSFASNNTPPTVTWRYASYPFGALPSTAPTSMTPKSIAPPNVYVIVAQ